MLGREFVFQEIFTSKRFWSNVGLHGKIIYVRTNVLSFASLESSKVLICPS